MPKSDSRPISLPSFGEPEYPCVDIARVRRLCASVASQAGNSMARKVGQIIAEATALYIRRVRT